MLPAVKLDLSLSSGDLTAQLIDVESVSGSERPLADAIQAALGARDHLTVTRDGNAVIARTELGRRQRVVLAGHIDTVPIAGNVPSRIDQGVLYGCGAADMKSGVAVQLKLAAEVTAPSADAKVLLTLVRAHLEREPPDDAVTGLHIVAATARIRATQLDLFRPNGPSAVALMRFETPRKSATNAVRGSSYISAGVAICSTCPSDITAMRSDIVNASS